MASRRLVKMVMQDEMTPFNDEMEKKNPSWRRKSPRTTSAIPLHSRLDGEDRHRPGSGGPGLQPADGEASLRPMDRQAISDEVFDALNSKPAPQKSGEIERRRAVRKRENG